MADEAQVKRIFERLGKVKPMTAFKCVDETQAGIGAVLRLLEESRETVTAGRISEVLNVSTARVAVLLKKMETKGLIKKERSSADGRVAVVSLTEQGADAVEKMRREIFRQMGHMIDVVGERRLLEFIDTAEEIQKALSPPGMHF